MPVGPFAFCICALCMTACWPFSACAARRILSRQTPEHPFRTLPTSIGTLTAACARRSHADRGAGLAGRAGAERVARTRDCRLRPA